MPDAALSAKKFSTRTLAIAVAALPVVAAGLLAAPSAHAEAAVHEVV
jgi:hypothetical protein